MNSGIVKFIYDGSSVDIPVDISFIDFNEEYLVAISLSYYGSLSSIQFDALF